MTRTRSLPNSEAVGFRGEICTGGTTNPPYLLGGQFIRRAHLSRWLCRDDPVLGLAWLRSRPDVFVSGSATGLTRINRISLGSGLDTAPSLMAMAEEPDPPAIRFSPIAERGLCSGNVIAESEWQEIVGELGDRPPPLEAHIKSAIMADFAKLTSVHVNSTDNAIVCSGYTKSVNVYDIDTGKEVRHLVYRRNCASSLVALPRSFATNTVSWLPKRSLQMVQFKAAHSAHINIARFAHDSPHMLATSSFDKTIKLWDLRVKDKPNYTITSKQGFVMITFSPDDLSILASAVDNDVSVFSALNGRTMFKLDAVPLGSKENYTRSYFVSEGHPDSMLLPRGLLGLKQGQKPLSPNACVLLGHGIR